MAKVKVVSWGAIFFQVKGTFQNLDFPKPTSCKQLVLNPVFFSDELQLHPMKAFKLHTWDTNGTLMFETNLYIFVSTPCWINMKHPHTRI